MHATIEYNLNIAFDAIAKFQLIFKSTCIVLIIKMVINERTIIYSIDVMSNLITDAIEIALIQ